MEFRSWRSPWTRAARCAVRVGSALLITAVGAGTQGCLETVTHCPPCEEEGATYGGFGNCVPLYTWMRTRSLLPGADFPGPGMGDLGRLQVGETAVLFVEGQKSATSASWRSSDPAVATVTAIGPLDAELRALKPGRAYIAATLRLESLGCDLHPSGEVEVVP